MKTNQHDIELIRKLGGPSKVAELIGLDKQGGAQRVQNWLVRGIPAQMKIDFPSIFMPELAYAPAVIAQDATESVAGESVDIAPTGALRTGAVRRHQVRRAKDLPLDVDRRAKSGPPFQCLETGVA